MRAVNRPLGSRVYIFVVLSALLWWLVYSGSKSTQEKEQQYLVQGPEQYNAFDRINLDIFQSRGQTSQAQGACMEKTIGELDQEDPCLVNIIRESGVLFPPPSTPGGPFMDKEFGIVSRGEAGQPWVVDKILRQQRNGFFVEVGAADGEHASNTFHLEFYRNWTGLLGEANPEFFSQLKSRRRPRSTLFSGCLSVTNHPDVVQFDAANYRGGIINQEESGPHMRPGDTAGSYKFPGRKTISVQCYPIYSLLKSMGNPTVDLFSLDVEGAELPILKTIPFDKINIRVLLVELRFAGKMFSGSKAEIVRLLRENGYRLVGGVHRDGIFVKMNDPLLAIVSQQQVEAIAEEVGAVGMAADIRPCLDGDGKF